MSFCYIFTRGAVCITGIQSSGSFDYSVVGVALLYELCLLVFEEMSSWIIDVKVSSRHRHLCPCKRAHLIWSIYSGPDVHVYVQCITP